MFREDTIDLKLLFSKLLAKWYYFLISLPLALSLAFVYLKLSDRIFMVEASVLLDAKQGNSWNNREQFIEGLEFFLPNNNIEDDIGLISSTSMIKSALENLDFEISYFAKDQFKYHEVYPSFPFDIKLDSISDQIVNTPIHIKFLDERFYSIEVEAEEVTSHNFVTQETFHKKFGLVRIDKTLKVGSKYSDQYLSFTLNLNENSGYFIGQDLYFTIHDINSLAQDFQSKLNVSPNSTESRIIKISTKGTVIEKEVNFINELVAVFLDEELRKKTEVGLRTINFLDEQLENITDSLQRAESNLETFRATNNIIDISKTSDNLAFRIERLEEDRDEIRDRLEYYNYVLQYLRSNSDVSNVSLPSSRGIVDPILHNLLEEQRELNQQKAGLDQRTSKNNPAVESLNRKIKEVNQAVIENVSNTINTTTNNLKSTQSRIASIQDEISLLPQNERKLVAIQRKFQFSDNIYNYLLEKRAEAGIAIAANMPSRAVIDEAKMVGRKAVSPKKTMVIFLALVLGLAAPLALILILDFLNDRITSVNDIKEITSFPVVSSIPYSTANFEPNSSNWKRSLLAESLNTTRINLRYIAAGQQKIVIAVTSGVPAEGKTFCSINLAISLSQSGKRVVLIDADLRKPRIAKILNINKKEGLSSYLINQVSLDDIITHSDQDNLDIIPAGPKPPNPLQLLELSKMKSMVASLKERYDYIVIDTPPVLLVSDFYIISDLVDSKLFVARQNFTKRQILDQLIEDIESKKIKGVGIILNGVSYKNKYGKDYYSTVKEEPKWKKVLELKSSVFLLCILGSLLFFNPIPVSAATYYISNIGSDKNPGTAPNAAWRTLDKVSSSAQLFGQGDSILFKRGHIFYGQLNFTASGTRLAPIYIGAYGTGNRPIIKGVKPINDWKNLPDNIWEANYNPPSGLVNNLFLHGVPQPLSRYPNQGYLQWSKALGKQQIVDSSFNYEDDYWKNATAVVRSSRWTLDQLVIDKQIGNEMYFQEPASYLLKKNWGYFIQNHPNAFDLQGEWSYDGFNGLIKILYGPPPLGAEISFYDFGIKLSGAHNTIVDGLKIWGQSETSLIAENCNHLQIRNSIFQHSGVNGMEINKCNYYIIENNRIIDIKNNGSVIKGSTGGVFRQNLLKRIGIEAGRGLNGNAQYNALIIRNFGKGGHTITSNVIDSIGYIGIDFRSENTIVSRNYIANFCMVKDDGGGIYTFNNRRKGNVISANLIVNGVGATAGIPTPTRPMAEGIYLDKGTANLLVSDNKILSCSKGIYVHNANNLIIERNISVANLNQITFKYDDIQGDSINKIYNCRVVGNVLLGLDGRQWSLKFKSIDEDIIHFGMFEGNYIHHTSKSKHIVVETNQKSKIQEPPRKSWSLADWQNSFKAMAGNNTNKHFPDRTKIDFQDSPIPEYEDELNVWQERIREILTLAVNS